MADDAPTDHEKATLARAITRAHGLAEKGHGAPIVAAIMEGDEVVAWGDNEVAIDHDPSRHAEIVAIAGACAERETSDLGGLTLVTTLQPCEMCLGAMRFARIERLIFAAGRPNVAERYFQFPGLGIEDFAKAADGKFSWVGHVMEEDVRSLYVPEAEEGAAGAA